MSRQLQPNPALCGSELPTVIQNLKDIYEILPKLFDAKKSDVKEIVKGVSCKHISCSSKYCPVYAIHPDDLAWEDWPEQYQEACSELSSSYNRGRIEQPG